MRRIQALPKRTWSPSQLDQLVRVWTEKLRTPDGTQILRGTQAQSLAELSQCGGLFGPQSVGTGKTLVTALAPTVRGALRPALVSLASLIRKTQKDFAELAPHWRVHRGIRLFSYEFLGREQGAHALEQYDPDILILDEAHRAKNLRAAVTRRLKRLIEKRPNICVVCLSGTMCKDGLLDFAHLLSWCLRERSPAPIKRGDIVEWGSALDLKPSTQGSWAPRRALEGLQPLIDSVPSNEDDLTRARKGFYARLVATPGVVATQLGSVDCSLRIEPFVVQPGPVAQRHFETLRKQWKNPDGVELAEAIQKWQVARQLAMGFHYYLHPTPPSQWFNARSRWAGFVRGVLAHSRTWDTELQVRRAVEGGKYKGSNEDAEGILADWLREASLIRPTPQERWHDTTVLEACAERMHKKGEPPALVWTDHTAFGRALAKAAEVPYVGDQGLTSDGRSAESFDGKQSIVLSIAANSTGRNLQRWARNIVTAPPASGAAWEQLIGRTHRAGQIADEVTIDALVACTEHANALYKAHEAARMTKNMMGQDQKLLLADVIPLSHQRGVTNFPTHAFFGLDPSVLRY